MTIGMACDVRALPVNEDQIAGAPAALVPVRGPVSAATCLPGRTAAVVVYCWSLWQRRRASRLLAGLYLTTLTAVAITEGLTAGWRHGI